MKEVSTTLAERRDGISAAGKSILARSRGVDPAADGLHTAERGARTSAQNLFLNIRNNLTIIGNVVG